MKFFRNIIIILIGIILICSLQVLFYGDWDLQKIWGMQGENDVPTIGFYPKEYALAIVDTIKHFVHPNQWVHQSFNRMDSFWGIYPDRYVYSFKILILSLLLAIVFSMLFTAMIALLPSWLKKIFTSIIDIVESLPDVFIIVGLQLLVVYIYLSSGTLLADIAMLNEEIYLLPVICLTTVPAVFITKTVLSLLREEEPKSYLDLAHSKGLSKWRILFVHSFRNVLFSLFYRSKLIFSFMLSNLFIIERLFNMNGVMNLLLSSESHLLVFMVFSLFLPFYTLFSITEFFILKIIGIREEIV